MKVKKELPKIKKKKSKLVNPENSSIKKTKKKKPIKVQNNSEIAEAVKKELADNQKNTPLRQQTWNAYLKAFSASEKLNKKQKLIMEFCTNKSLTPPRRKQKFLNFIRNCYENQTEVTDEQCNELFDSLLKKYTDYKAGKYSVSENNAASSESTNDSPTAKLSKNKKKKLKKASNNVSPKTDSVKTETTEKWEKTKPKKRKRRKVSTARTSDEDVEMDE